MRPILIAGALIALAAAPAIATETDKPDREPSCAWANQLDSFSLIDDKTIVLKQSASKRFKVTLTNSCRDLRFEERIAVKSATSCLSRGDTLLVHAPGGFVIRCHIADVEFLQKGDDGKGNMHDEDKDTRTE